MYVFQVVPRTYDIGSVSAAVLPSSDLKFSPRMRQQTHRSLLKNPFASRSPHECPICQQEFSDRHTLRRHKRIHTGEKPFKCPVCKKMFARRDYVSSHQNVHRSFTCAICNAKFKRKDHFKTHLKMHSGREGEDAIACPICNKKFSYAKVLIRHMQSHEEHPCLICHKSFSYRRDLTRHQKVHKRERPFECPVCTKTFARNDYVRQHMQTHRGAFPEIQKSFRTHSEKSTTNTGQESSTRPEIGDQNNVDSMSNQPKIQQFNFESSELPLSSCVRGGKKRPRTGNTLHGCSFCFRKYANKRDLLRHVKSHLLWCPVCSMNFESQISLQKHLRTHTEARAKGEKGGAFKCPACRRNFTRGDSLRLHAQNHAHYGCSICSKVFSDASYLRTHVQTHGLFY